MAWGCAPYCYIDCENLASLRLFTKLGFIKQSECSWQGYLKPSPSTVQVLCAEADDLPGILSLHKANHISSISASEAEREGFVTALYSLEELTAMNIDTCAIIAKDSLTNRVVGYALAVDKQSKLAKDHSLLGPLIAMIDQIEYCGVPLARQPYIVVGQFCIAKGYRGMGIAARIYEAFRRRYMKQFRFCVTDISARNPRSLKAHLKAGFQVLQRFTESDGSSWDIVLYDFFL
jgi:GNAT superfamily N-acetyltransferase